MQIIIFLLVMVLMFGFFHWRDKRRNQWEAEARVAGSQIYSRVKDEVEQALRRIPTSSTNTIVGKKIVAQLRVISVKRFIDPKSVKRMPDPECEQAIQELNLQREFLRIVEDAGGNGVVNMVIERKVDGNQSIQGDAVRIDSLDG